MEPADTATAAELSLEATRSASISTQAPSLPGYTLGQRLGGGAFGVVYQATQNSTGQAVAVKVLNAVNTRLQDEVDRLSRVSDHPNIVTLVDADLQHDPPFLVTPLLTGSLAARVPSDAGQAPIAEIVSWFKEITQALEFVHARGILHCDLKPANVLVGEEGQARLVDFGQAVLEGGPDSHLGSFWFMPRQQTEGRLPEVGWDLHALGATIYQLLTGRLPRATPRDRQTLRQLRPGKQQVEAYRTFFEDAELVPVRAHNPGVDPELAAIVEGCLKGSYSTASEITNDLQRRDDCLPLQVRPLTGLYWLERFSTRHRLSLAVGLLAVMVLVLGLGSASYQVYQARQAQAKLIRSQFEMGVSLLARGRASGLVWMARAHQHSPNPGYQVRLEDGLARQLRIADPKRYRIETATAPSPSGRWCLWKNPKNRVEKKLMDLRDGTLAPLPPWLSEVPRDQKDVVRFRLDGVVLDPVLGQGGPAVWQMRAIDSLTPGQKQKILALFVSPDLVLSAERASRGVTVFDRHRRIRFEAQRHGLLAIQTTFSLQGDLVVSWEDGTVELFSLSSNGQPLALDRNFRSELLCVSRDGTRLAGSDGQQGIRVWNRSGEVVENFEVGAPVNDMAFDEASQLLVCATRDGLVHGFSLTSGERAWWPAELEKAARWIFVQPDGQVVTMSDEVTVWAPPQGEPIETHNWQREIALRTGWVYDENARVRTLSAAEYSQRFDSLATGSR